MPTNKALTLALLAVGICSLATAQNARVALNMKSQPMRAALKDLGAQAGVQILFRVEDVARDGKAAPAVSGQLSVPEALDRLLADTGLKYEFVNERTVRVAKAESDAAGEARSESPPAAERGDAVQKSDQQSIDAQSLAGLEEIVVTATKRSERLQDVPSSISVVTAEEIDRRGLVDAEDYLRGIPGVNHTDSGNGQSIVIRGMETSPLNQNIFSGATTATYFGETPTTNSAGLGSGTNVDLKLVDIERVEVLRGPQGTAFGNSSLGGAVRTIPALPQLDRYGGKVVAGVSSTAREGGENYDVQVVGNLPLIRDKLAIRVAGYRFEDSGAYRNRAGSDASFQTEIAPFGADDFARDQDEVGAQSVLGGRIAAQFQPNDALRVTLSYLTQKTEIDGMPVASRASYGQAMLQVAPEHVVRGRTEGLSDADIDIANVTLDLDLGWANLLATYSHTDSGSTLAQPYQLYGRPWPASFYANSEHREDVGEIRLVTQLTGAWKFLAGLYLEKLEDQALFDYRWYGSPEENFFNPGERLVGDRFYDWDLKQKAAFGEASWEFVPRLTLTAGVRAYDYERITRQGSPSEFFFVPVPPGMTTTAGDASGTNLRANLSYKLQDEAMLYAGWSQGFRLGQPQVGLLSCDADGDGIVDGTDTTVDSTKEVESDRVDSYELGGKFTLLERRLTINTAVFRMDWSEIPVRVAAGSLTTGCGLVYLTNAGSAKSEGVELQASFQVTEPLRVDFGGSWIDAQLTEDVPEQSFVAGDRLPGSPKVNANLGVQYEFDVGRYPAFVRADSVYVGRFYDDVLESPDLRSGDYVKLDASARVRIRNLSIDLFVRNLTNEDAFTFRGAFAGVGEYFGYRLRPRTIGLQFTYALN